MATNYIRESAEQMIQKCLLGGIGLAVLGGVMLGLTWSAAEVNAWAQVAALALIWTGSAATFVALVGFGVKLGNEATMRKEAS